MNDWNGDWDPLAACQGMAGPTVEGIGMEPRRPQCSGHCARHAGEAARFPEIIQEALTVLSSCLVPLRAVSLISRQRLGEGGSLPRDQMQIFQDPCMRILA
jgi:hypothetical protein